MDRLSTLDAEFLHLEDERTHLHIAGIAVFEGPVPTLDEVTGLIKGKLHHIPRYRQRVRDLPLELGRPVWVDDPHFNIEYHVRHSALPSPGDDAALSRLMSRLMSQPLDRNRPLWEAYLVEGLPDGKWALIFKVHHCMVDGVAGVGLLTVLLDIAPDPEVPIPAPWWPTPEPTRAAMVVNAWLGLAGDAAGRGVRAAATVAHPREAAEQAWQTALGASRYIRHLGARVPTSLEGAVGPHRRWTHVTVDLAEVKRIGKAMGGTVNDVVLAAVTAGWRAYLEHREDPLDEAVRTLVPVSVRHGDGVGVPDNRVSAMLAELPTHLSDPKERFDAVREEMAELKASHMAEAGEWVTSVGDLMPPMIVGTASRLAMRALKNRAQRAVTTVTTNVPGPQFPLYCLGREMLEYRPYVPIAHGASVTTAILSYNGHLDFGITGDYDRAPDIEVLARGIAHGIEELGAIV
jgi:WS/DGAT/MGAT family acyltransferase